MAWMQIMVVTIVCTAILIDVIKGNEKQSQCDRCKRLKRKGGRSFMWKYDCDMIGNFDKPPEYCRGYEPREDD